MKWLIIACGIAVLPSSPYFQGNQLEIVRQPIRAMRLEGYVRLHDHTQGIANVRIDVCDLGWKHVLSSTVTDGSGHFNLEPATAGSTYYLRLTAPGFNLREYTVKLSKHAPVELKLELNVGT